MKRETVLACEQQDCDGVLDRCAPDGSAWEKDQEPPDQTVRLRFYICPACGQKAAVMFELGRQGASQYAQGWVENELRTNGYWFPSDYTGSDSKGPKGPW